MFVQFKKSQTCSHVFSFIVVHMVAEFVGKGQDFVSEAFWFPSIVCLLFKYY